MAISTLRAVSLALEWSTASERSTLGWKGEAEAPAREWLEFSFEFGWLNTFAVFRFVNSPLDRRSLRHEHRMMKMM